MKNASIARLRRTATSLTVAGVAFAVALPLSGSGSERRTVEQTTVAKTTVPPPPPPTFTAISFTDLHPEPSADPSTEKVVGTIINSGDRPVSKIAIRVEGKNDAGQVLTSVVTPPLDQTIDAYGGRATFEANLPRVASVTTYHAVAIAR
jgi:hypothetical protein